jgi:hypothetical protein
MIGSSSHFIRTSSDLRHKAGVERHGRQPGDTEHAARSGRRRPEPSASFDASVPNPSGPAHLTKAAGVCQHVLMGEERLEGGYADGAVRVGDTVRRPAGPWTPAVHALLACLADRKPRPAWVHAEDTLVQVARWMRDYHQVVADFIPPPGAVWREGGTWSPGLIIAHNDATTHNAAWCQGKLTGFFDWDFAGPATPEWDLALAAFTWVPLHVRYVVAAEGFTDFAARPRRLDRFLGTYGWSGTTGEFLDVVEARMTAHAVGIRAKAAAGDEPSGRLLRQGVPDAIDQALADLASFPRQDAQRVGMPA